MGKLRGKMIDIGTNVIVDATMIVGALFAEAIARALVLRRRGR